MQNKQCQNCYKSFKITDDDQKYYNSINVPIPEKCPDCRMQQRLSFRNERNFYIDICQKCKKNIVSQYHPNSKLNIYCEKCYWQDDWAGQDYGRNFDFNKSFSEQFYILMLEVPKMAMIHTESENSEYSHLAARNKNCFMLIESSDNENCLYSYWLQKCNDCVDASHCHECQLIYNSDNLTNCYKLQNSFNCENCLDSKYLLNCTGCQNCFACCNLKNQKYHILNKLYSKENYVSEVNRIQDNIKLINNFFIKQPRKYSEIYNAENCNGNYIHHAKNCQHIFHCYDAENCRYSEHVWRQAKECMDVSTAGINAELVYDAINCGLDVYNIKFSNQCWHGCADLDYCFYCGGLKNSFGCTGIKQGKNCILNKEYKEADYLILKQKIINQMQQSGEWGKFIDSKYSFFGYNETIAGEQYPLNKAEAQNTNFNWYNKADKQNDPNLLICVNCCKNFNIIKQERKFYKDNNIKDPIKCPDCRHKERINKRGPNKLWHRECMKPDCHNTFETAYSPERKELIYCEKCYQQKIY
ncbi:MAG: zinc-ribbon domain containing protein [Patescibacteria group bacterium]